MNRNALNLLGCSGSLAFMLVAGNAANAGTLSPQATGFVVRSTTATTQTVHSLSSQEATQLASLDPNSDTVGDLAIAKFGCDCPSCRNKIMALLQTGSLTLPQ